MILVPATLRWHWWRFSARAFVWSMGASVVLILSRLVALPRLPAYASLAVDVGLCLTATLVISA